MEMMIRRQNVLLLSDRDSARAQTLLHVSLGMQVRSFRWFLANPHRKWGGVVSQANSNVDNTDSRIRWSNVSNSGLNSSHF